MRFLYDIFAINVNTLYMYDKRLSYIIWEYSPSLPKMIPMDLVVKKKLNERSFLPKLNAEAPPYQSCKVNGK